MGNRSSINIALNAPIRPTKAIVFTFTPGLAPATVPCFKASFFWLISPILLKYNDFYHTRSKAADISFTASESSGYDKNPERTRPGQIFAENVFSHPDYTVGSGIPPERGHQISRLSGSWTIPSVGNFTLPQRLLYSIFRIR
ncbi:hypothetical protein IMSAGC015_01682 [Lachnospiraceae bacterium]|nr:hypothetical protein IMSAGC015_01682 [Lachnospiraceae bacterium]